MLDFACKKIQIEEVIRCGLGITKSDYKMLMLMLRSNTRWFTAIDLSKSMNLDISTIQRSVKRLYEKQAIQRKQKNLDNGGYLFYYKIREKDNLIELINGIVQDWAKRVDKELRRGLLTPKHLHS